MGKPGAAEQWRDALASLPDEEWANRLRASDIHDRADRMEIEEEIEHDVPEEYYLRLHDAFDDLQSAFGW